MSEKRLLLGHEFSQYRHLPSCAHYIGELYGYCGQSRSAHYAIDPATPHELITEARTVTPDNHHSADDYVFDILHRLANALEAALEKNRNTP